MKKGVKYQRVHKNKYDKRSYSKKEQEDYEHMMKRSSNYYRRKREMK